MDEQIIKKLQALLRMRTDRGATEAEMQSAMAAAQRLALRHRINLKDIDSGEESTFVQAGLVHKTFKMTYASDTVKPPSHRYILSILERYFGVKVVLLEGVKCAVIGTEVDVDFAIYVFSFLRGEFNRLWTIEKGLSFLAEKAKQSFFRGLFDGLQTKLAAVKDEVMKEAGKGGELVLVANESALMAKMKELYPDTRKDKSRRVSYNQEAYDAGVEQGKTVNINRPLV